MRDPALYALSISAASALLAACGGSQPPNSAAGAIPQASALAARTNSSNFKVVHSFGNAPDGNHPTVSLIDVDGIASAGETIASRPETRLIDVKGALYGTTYASGANVCGVYYPGEGCGTVFSITTVGTESIVHCSENYISNNPHKDSPYELLNL